MKAFAVLTLWATVCFGIEPPVLSPRGVPAGEPAGEQFRLQEGGMEFVLFLPPNWNSNANAQTLTMHFHTAPQFIIHEHVRRGSRNPLACFQLGEGSAVYRRAFEEPERFARVLSVIAEAIQKRSSKNVVIRAIELSSFSAGYGAIRELVKSRAAFQQISAVVLADSMYGSLATNAAVRQPSPEHIDVWVPLARAAMKREKTFVFTYSEVPTPSYASSAECAAALIHALSLTNSPVTPHAESLFPLLRRTDFGNLHLWGYGGTNAPAHVAHVRHLADIWKTIDSK